MRRIVITGCSGAGKSTLIKALAGCGHATVAEPGRRVIEAERASGGTGFPWADIDRFSDLAFWMAVGDHSVAETDPTFFDRSALDQAAWYARQGTAPPASRPDYARDVIMAPPWPEIFEEDADRRHSFDSALEEYEDLAARLPGWGYRIHILPKDTVDARLDWVLGLLPRIKAE